MSTRHAGYADPMHAASLSEFGDPLELARSAGWLLRRSIAGTALIDAMGPYPLFSCDAWGRLDEDLAGYPALVSVSLVADPFGDYDEPTLGQAFDMVIRLKPHVVYDLSRPRERAVGSSTRPTKSTVECLCE